VNAIEIEEESLVKRKTRLPCSRVRQFIPFNTTGSAASLLHADTRAWSPGALSYSSLRM
jgi:hypothetical protein